MYRFLAFGATIVPRSKLRIADALKKRAVWECDVRRRRSDKAPLATTTTMDAKSATMTRLRNFKDSSGEFCVL